MSKEREKRPKLKWRTIDMKIKKLTAAAAAIAVLAVAAPMTGVLPYAVGMTASAAELKAGESFVTGIDKQGNLTGKSAVGDSFMGLADQLAETDENGNLNLSDTLICTVKEDGTIKVEYELLPVRPQKLYGMTLTIPSEINGYKVSEISGNSWGASGCKKIVIPETVKVINQSAFVQGIALEEVEFSGNSQLELIDKWAFQDCRSLKSITIPASVETIAYGAFMNGTQELFDNFIGGDYSNVYSLTSVKFAEGSKLKVLGDHAFERQNALESITLPDSLEEIGQGTFNGCLSLTGLDLPANLRKIGDFAFTDCISLTKLDIPANVSEIGNYTFALSRKNIDKTSKLTEVNVSEGNKSFKSVDGIVYSKDGKKLVGCPAGKSEVKFADGVTEIQKGAIQGCNQITSVTIPDTITKLPVDAFALCINLKDVKLPETLTAIDKWALQKTAVANITIPESVTAIDPQAFEETDLKNINGKSGSYAETFAKENGYTFNSTASETPTEPSKPAAKPVDYSDDTTGIKAAANEGVVADGAKLSVAAVADKTDDKNFTYDISFKKDDKNVQPNGAVTVKIPVPEAIKDKPIYVYRVDGGKYYDMGAKVENGFIVFETDHFSEYLVTTEKNENAVKPSTPGKNPATGIAGGVFGIMAIAGAVMIVSKKRR